MRVNELGEGLERRDSVCRALPCDRPRYGLPWLHIAGGEQPCYHWPALSGVPSNRCWLALLRGDNGDHRQRGDAAVRICHSVWRPDRWVSRAQVRPWGKMDVLTPSEVPTFQCTGNKPAGYSLDGKSARSPRIACRVAIAARLHICMHAGLIVPRVGDVSHPSKRSEGRCRANCPHFA